MGSSKKKKSHGSKKKKKSHGSKKKKKSGSHSSSKFGSSKDNTITVKIYGAKDLHNNGDGTYAKAYYNKKRVITTDTVTETTKPEWRETAQFSYKKGHKTLSVKVCDDDDSVVGAAAIPLDEPLFRSRDVTSIWVPLKRMSSSKKKKKGSLKDAGMIRVKIHVMRKAWTNPKVSESTLVDFESSADMADGASSDPVVGLARHRALHTSSVDGANPFATAPVPPEDTAELVRVAENPNADDEMMLLASRSRLKKLLKSARNDAAASASTRAAHQRNPDDERLLNTLVASAPQPGHPRAPVHGYGVRSAPPMMPYAGVAPPVGPGAAPVHGPPHAPMHPHAAFASHALSGPLKGVAKREERDQFFLRHRQAARVPETPDNPLGRYVGMFGSAYLDFVDMDTQDMEFRRRAAQASRGSKLDRDGFLLAPADDLIQFDKDASERLYRVVGRDQVPAHQ